MIDHGKIAAMRTRTPRFTPKYEECLSALRKACRKYSPEKYQLALRLLTELAEHDDVEDVTDLLDTPSEADFLSDYLKIAGDNSLMVLAARLDSIHQHQAA